MGLNDLTVSFHLHTPKYVYKNPMSSKHFLFEKQISSSNYAFITACNILLLKLNSHVGGKKWNRETATYHYTATLGQPFPSRTAIHSESYPFLFTDSFEPWFLRIFFFFLPLGLVETKEFTNCRHFSFLPFKERF